MLIMSEKVKGNNMQETIIGTVFKFCDVREKSVYFDCVY